LGEKTDVWQGTLALMVLRTLETLGPLHGYGLARRIEQTSGDLLQLNYGTLCSSSNRKASSALAGAFLITTARQNFTSLPKPVIAS
jgi:hypothetical protein